MSTHTAEEFPGDEHLEHHAENVGKPDEEREVGIADADLPEDVRPSDDNPLAQGPEPDVTDE